MKGTLYVITNTINGKQYVGKTYNTLAKRFNEHIKLAKTNSTRPLYKAINEFGIDNFQIESLGIFEEKLLELQETLEIEKRDSFKNGYNATLGGEGSRKITIPANIAINCYKKHDSLRKASEELGINVKTLQNILRNNDFTIPSSQEVCKKQHEKKIIIQNLNFLGSLDEGVEIIKKLQLTSASTKSIKEGINRVLRGDRKSYLGLNITILE